MPVGCPSRRLPCSSRLGEGCASLLLDVGVTPPPLRVAHPPAPILPFSFQLADDYANDIDGCDGTLGFGVPRSSSSTPAYGCISTASPGSNVSAGAMYYATISPDSRAPCAYDSVSPR